jgi:hypothetical protein
VGFLEICSPAVAEIYCYWNHKRGERSMPRRADIDPIDLKAVLETTLYGLPQLGVTTPGPAQSIVRSAAVP